MNMIENLPLQKHSFDHPIRWGDMDSLNHVNNTIYFRYFQEARIHYFQDSGVSDILANNDIGFILASTQCKFKFPLTYPDTMTIESYPTAISNDRITVKQHLISQKHKKVACECTSIVVAYDHEKKSKSTLPNELILLINPNLA